MSRLEEYHEEECAALGLTIESAQSFPLIHLIGHAPVSTQKLKEFFGLIEHLGRLGQRRNEFFDSAPETWWEKLSDQGKQNAEGITPYPKTSYLLVCLFIHY